MKTIRENIFETNSSSTHTLTILTSKEFDLWENDDIRVNIFTSHHIKKEDPTFEQYPPLKELRDNYTSVIIGEKDNIVAASFYSDYYN